MVNRKIEERVRRGDLRHNALERRMRLDRGGPLDPTAVTAADHPDLSIRPALPANPINRVVTVFPLMNEWRPLAAALIAAARVLNNVGVTALRPPFAREFREVFPAIRSSLEDGGIFTIVGRADNFGNEFDSISHFDLDALFSP